MHLFKPKPSPLDPPLADRLKRLPGAVLLTAGYMLSTLPAIRRPRD
jgi:hypothetical protein